MSAGSSRPDAELLSLAHGYCNGTLGAEDLARLERLLLDDAEARKHFRRCLALDAALFDYGQSQSRDWLEAEKALSPASLPAPFASLRDRLGAGLTIGISIALATVVAIAVVMMKNGQGGAESVVSLEQVKGDVRILGADGQVRVVDRESLLYSGDTVKTIGSESSTLLAYADGTRLTLAGNSSVTCGERHSKNIIVQQGALAAAVQPQPRGKPMLLVTPSAQVQVLGTRFLIESGAHRTNLSVTEGLVRVVRLSDGQALEIPDGKQALITAQSQLAVHDIPSPAFTWEADFEQGLPTGWDVGERVTEKLPEGSQGAVQAVRHEHEDQSVLYMVSSHEAWLHGLFAVGKRSHLHFTFKMQQPKWFNVLIVTRTSDPNDPRFSGNYLLKDFPLPESEQWHTLSVPLADFKRIHRGEAPLEELTPYKLTFFSDAPDRGLVIDRIWITPDGPGQLVLEALK